MAFYYSFAAAKVKINVREESQSKIELPFRRVNVIGITPGNF